LKCIRRSRRRGEQRRQIAQAISPMGRRRGCRSIWFQDFAGCAFDTATLDSPEGLPHRPKGVGPTIPFVLNRAPSRSPQRELFPQSHITDNSRDRYCASRKASRLPWIYTTIRIRRSNCIGMDSSFRRKWTARRKKGRRTSRQPSLAGTFVPGRRFRWQPSTCTDRSAGVVARNGRTHFGHRRNESSGCVGPGRPCR
jgi:hypothetical protein